MGFKLGLIAGAATGYVLGTRAGRERYIQIRDAFDTLMGSQTARHLEDGLRDAWDSAQQEWPGAATIGDVLGDR